MQKLAEFLRRRLDEDRKAAAEAADVVGPHWRSVEPTPPPEAVTHIVRHDPATVLDMDSALREVIKRCESTSGEFPEQVLKALTLAYVDHPDHQEDWMPWRP